MMPSRSAIPISLFLFMPPGLFCSVILLVVDTFNWKYLLKNLTHVRAVRNTTNTKLEKVLAPKISRLKPQQCQVPRPCAAHTSLFAPRNCRLLFFLLRGNEKNHTTWRALVETRKVSPSDKGSSAPVMRRKGTC